MLTAIFIISFVVLVVLPHVIRAVKWVYRNVIRVWADEVRKAWTE